MTSRCGRRSAAVASRLLAEITSRCPAAPQNRAVSRRAASSAVTDYSDEKVGDAVCGPSAPNGVVVTRLTEGATASRSTEQGLSSLIAISKNAACGVVGEGGESLRGVNRGRYTGRSTATVGRSSRAIVQN